MMQKKIKTNETEETEEIDDKTFSVVKTIIIAVICCLTLWIIGMCLTRWMAENFFPNNSKDVNLYALFGDSFGAVNALISAFAFAGIIVTIVIQQNELRLQRKDLRLQKKESVIQNKTLKLQRFENTFFNMLRLQQEIVANLKFYSRANGYSTLRSRDLVGREIFEDMFNKSYINEEPFRCYNGGFIGIKEVIELYGMEDGYANVKEISLFDHYFRHLYRIIKFVDKSDILTQDEKFQYVGMLRATLSRYELIFLFCNGLIYPKSKEQIETYGLLQNMRCDDITLCGVGNYNKYKETAFSNDEE